MSIRTAVQARKSPRGFTLLELAVVLFIIGLVLAIAMPYFGGLKTSELKSQARRLASHATYLYEEAGAQKVMLRLTFDLNNNTYFASRLDPFAFKPVFMPETGPAGGHILMPEGVRIRDVWVEGAGAFKRGVVSCQFYPSGAADAAVIHLISDDGVVLTLAINPFNGHVAIIRGDLSPSAIAQMANR